MYAGLFVRVSATIGELRQAGELMYYAGDIAELLLAFAMVSTWRRSKTKDNAARPGQCSLRGRDRGRIA